MVAEQPVFPEVDFEDVRATIGSLQNDSISAKAVVEELVGVVEPMLVGTTGPRYFGFVVGGAGRNCWNEKGKGDLVSLSAI